MPTKLFDFIDKDSVSGDDLEVFVRSGNVSLRKFDDFGNIDRRGEHPEFSVIDFEEFSAEGLIEFFAFEEKVNYPIDKDGKQEGSVTYQISTDGGSSYYHAVGSGWVIASSATLATEFSSASGMDFIFPTLPFSKITPKFKLRARIESTPNRLKAPEINAIAVHHELRYDLTQDMKESLQAHLDGILIQTPERAKMPEGGGTSLDISDFDILLKVVGIVDAVNLTTNDETIFSAYDSGTKIITFTGSQSANDLIQFEVVMKPVIFIGADEDYEISSNNCIVIEVSSFVERTDIRTDNLTTEKSLARSTSRIREEPIPWDAEAFIRCISDTQKLADLLASAVIKLFAKKKVVKSLKTGQSIVVLDALPFTDTSDVKGNLWALTGGFTFRMIVPREEYDEVPLLKKLVITHGETQGAWNRATFDFEQDTETNVEI